MWGLRVFGLRASGCNWELGLLVWDSRCRVGVPSIFPWLMVSRLPRLDIPVWQLYRVGTSLCPREAGCRSGSRRAITPRIQRHSNYRLNYLDPATTLLRIIGALLKDTWGVLVYPCFLLTKG